MRALKVKALSLFVTNDFINSEWIKNKFSNLEVYVTHDELPPGHFGTYFGALPVKTYENKYVQDLYHLHELSHVLATRYDPDDSFMEWSKKMIAAEFEASITSECYAYIYIPGLRAKTFEHEIWVDRFGPIKINYTYWEEVMREERMRAVNCPKYNDFLEQQIRNYSYNNFTWCRIWCNAFREIEAHMSNINLLDEDQHNAWLALHSTNSIPFASEAIAFAEVYKTSNANYGNWLLTK